MGKSKGPSVARIVLVVISGIAVLSLLGVDIWRTDLLTNKILDLLKLDRAALSNIEAIVNISRTDPLVVFRSFFQLPEQRQRRLDMYEKMRNATETKRPENCAFRCAPNPPGKRSVDETEYPSLPVVNRNRRNVGQGKKMTYHGCCSSKRYETTPGNATNLNGETRYIVQNRDYNQYFVTEECNQENACSGCQCQQPDDYLYDAVVYIGATSNDDATNMEIDTIRIKGCCKCLNV